MIQWISAPQVTLDFRLNTRRMRGWVAFSPVVEFSSPSFEVSFSNAVLYKRSQA